MLLKFGGKERRDGWRKEGIEDWKEGSERRLEGTMDRREERRMKRTGGRELAFPQFPWFVDVRSVVETLYQRQLHRCPWKLVGVSNHLFIDPRRIRVHTSL